MNFSQRIGKTEVRTILQKNSIDDVLKTKLWNVFYDDFIVFLDKEDTSFLISCFKDIWTDLFNRKSNTFSISNDYNLQIIEKWFFGSSKWFEVYDFIERIAHYQEFWKDNFDDEYLPKFIDNCNFVLEKELSAFRIVNYQVTPISDKQEIQSIEEAINNNDKFKGVTTHLEASIKYLSDREKPDYRNSIKESISAVETICKIITGESTLGKSLKKIENSGIKIHQHLQTAFEKLYAYTNDSKTGIRHAFLEDNYSPDFDEAKFMLVTCTSFINYLKSKI
jgi:AbiJ N-terminal domain 4